jgi:hypothetical protein
MAILPYKKIPKFIGTGNYDCDVFWSSLKDTFEWWTRDYGLDLDPPYQRGHVWNEAQQRDYVEFVIRGGQSAKNLLFNCPGWNSRGGKIVGPIELVDGKQRLCAVQRFMRDELTVFDSFPGIGPTKASEFEVIRDLELRFKFYINGLDTRAEVLQWYLEINAGGTPHTKEELEKVRTMMLREGKGSHGKA